MRQLILALSLLALAPSAFAQQRFAPPKVSTLTGLLGNQGDIVNLVGTGDYLCSAATCASASDWQQITYGGIAPTLTNVTLSDGGALRTDTTTAHTAVLQAYDNNTGPGYVTFCTFTNGNTPSMACSPPAGGATMTFTSPTLVTPTLGAATATTLTTNAVIGNGTIPAVSNTSANSCGTDAATMAANSTNTAGAFTVGATAGTSCTLTFTTAAPHFWVCSGSDESGTPAAVPWVRVDTTSGKFVAAFVAADVVNYVCAAY